MLGLPVRTAVVPPGGGEARQLLLASPESVDQCCNPVDRAWHPVARGAVITLPEGGVVGVVHDTEVRSGRRRSLVALAVLGLVVAVITIVVGVVVHERQQGHPCALVACTATVRVDVSSLVTSTGRQLKGTACLNNGLCGDVSSIFGGRLAILLPQAGGRPDSIAVSQIRITDETGTVLFDGSSTSSTATHENQINGEGCDPDCWFGNFAVDDGQLVPRA